MAISRGVFLLSDIIVEQATNSWSRVTDVWITSTTNFPQPSNFGYFGGGQSPFVSTVDRIDYANDTATAAVKGPLSVARYLLAATGNSNFGYFGGGYTSVDVSTVDRIDYANDTATAVSKGPLSLARRELAATSSPTVSFI